MRKTVIWTPTACVLYCAMLFAAGCSDQTERPAEEKVKADSKRPPESQQAANPSRPARKRIKLSRRRRFVIVSRPGGIGFERLSEALSGAQTGDVIEVRGNGKIPVSECQFADKEIALIAAPGDRPVLTVDFDSIPKGKQPQVELVKGRGGRLTLAGLAFEIDLKRKDVNRLIFWKLTVARLRLLHCTVDAKTHDDAQSRSLFVEWEDDRAEDAPDRDKPVLHEVRNSIFRGVAAGLVFRPYVMKLSLENCLFSEVEQPLGVYPHVSLGLDGSEVNLSGSTFVNAPGRGIIQVAGRTVAAAPPPTIRARNNLFIRRWREVDVNPLVNVRMFTPSVPVAKESFRWTGGPNGQIGDGPTADVATPSFEQRRTFFRSQVDWRASFPGSDRWITTHASSFLQPVPEESYQAPLECYRLLPGDPLSRAAADGSDLGVRFDRLGAGLPFHDARTVGAILLP